MGELAPGLGQNLWVTAVVLLACVVSLWLLSIRLRDASIIDIFWGPAFGVVALVGYVLADGHGVEVRRTLVTVLTVAWAARLGIYLYWRNHGKGEDPRYTAAYRNRFPTEPALAHADQGVPAAGIARLADLDAGAARAVSRAAARARSGGDRRRRAVDDRLSVRGGRGLAARALQSRSGEPRPRAR